MTVQIFNRAEFEADLDAYIASEEPGHDDVDSDGGAGFRTIVLNLAARVIARGDWLCVYENRDLGHPLLGVRQFASYGGDESLMGREQFPDEPPATLPDFNGAINWRYQLVAICREGQ